jgi:hypothetical protein
MAAQFVRWQYDNAAGHGTCVPCPTIVVNEEEGDEYRASFLDDLSRHHVITRAVESCQDAIDGAESGAREHLAAYFSASEHLWNPKREQLIEGLLKGDATCSAFEGHLGKYASDRDNARAEQRSVACSFLLIRQGSVTDAVADQAQVWVS